MRFWLSCTDANIYLRQTNKYGDDRRKIGKKERPLSAWFYVSLFLGGVILLVLYIFLSSQYPNLGLWWTIVENTGIAMMLGVILSFTLEKWHSFRIDQITGKVDNKINEFVTESKNYITTVENLTPQKFLESLFPDLGGILEIIRSQIIDSSFIYEKCIDTVTLTMQGDGKHIIFGKESIIWIKNRTNAPRKYQARAISSSLAEPGGNAKITRIELEDKTRSLKVVIDVPTRKIIETNQGRIEEKNFEDINEEILSVNAEDSEYTHQIKLTYNYDVDPNSTIIVKIKSQQILQIIDTSYTRFNYVTLSAVLIAHYDREKIELGFEPIHPYLHVIPNNELWETLSTGGGWEILKPLLPTNGYLLYWNPIATSGK